MRKLFISKNILEKIISKKYFEKFIYEKYLEKIFIKNMFDKKKSRVGYWIFFLIGVQQIRACASRGIPAHLQVIVSDLFAPAGVLSHGYYYHQHHYYYYYYYYYHCYYFLYANMIIPI